MAEVGVEVGAPFLEKIVEYLVDPIKRQFTYMCCFNTNITELETQLKDLETTRQGVQMGADENRRKVRVVGPNVEAWLTRANEVTTEIEGIIQDEAKVKEGCLNGWCPNLKLRYSLSRKAVKKTKVVVDLKADGVQYTQSSYSPPPACLETITNRDFTEFESRRANMEDIIKALTDDRINLIGVCGMAGVGKTKMVKEVRERVKEERLFDEVAFVAVGQNLEITKVQNSIADNFGLKDLKTQDDATTRASLLRRRLSQHNKKILLILDDIWAEFNLEDHGIPLGGSHETFKIIYTSRFRGIWHAVPNKKEILLELLSEDEAWQLFREKAGDLADARALQPIAKQIVNECGRLPLALVLIGTALLKRSERNTTTVIWEEMLDRLTRASNTPADEQLSSCLALSYEYLEDLQAKRLFLLCCLFQEDEDIDIEDLARYGLGLSLFDGINEMEKVRRQVLVLVDNLKSNYLLLDGKDDEFVKVHDVVRYVGISIAAKDRGALVIHGEASKLPKDNYEDYTFISLILTKITELPKELACPKLEFLLLDCKELEELPCNFFEGMGKLKVLVLNNFKGMLSLPSSLRNLHTLSLSNFDGKLDNVSEFGGIFNLKTLSFRNSWMEELPEEIGELVDLRLLDLTGNNLKRIPPNVISRLVNLEELYVGSLVDLAHLHDFQDWEGEGKEEEGRNANLRELKFLSNLNTLEILIRSHVLIPKVRIFSKLKIYKVIIVQDDKKMDDAIWDMELEDETCNLFCKCKRVFLVGSSIPIPLNRGGIDSLLRSSDCLFLEGKGCNDLVQALLRDGVDGLQQLKLLRIRSCDTPECLINTMNPVHLPIAHAHAPAIFPILKVLDLLGLNLREICGGPVPALSFGELTFIRIHNCGRLRNLFQLRIVECLPQLKSLIISSCGMMEEVFWKDQPEDVHAATNRIGFPKLEVLQLVKLPRLIGFCRGIDQIDFPQLKELRLQDMPQFNLLFHNNGNVGFLPLFPEKVSLPNLDLLCVDKLENLERLELRPLSVGSFSKLNKIFLRDCGKLLCVIPSQFLPILRELQELTVESCNSLEVVFELEGLESNESNPKILPPLKFVKLCKLPKLNCISKRDPVGIKYIQTLEIHNCNSLRYVFAPTMTKSIPQLYELKISSCEMLSRIVAEENGLGESSVDEVEIHQLERLELLDLPNLMSFFPNVNTATPAKSNDHLYNPMQPQPLFNKKVAIPNLEYMKLSGLQNVSELCGSELPTSSFSKLKNLQVIGCTSLRNIPCILWSGDLNNIWSSDLNNTWSGDLNITWSGDLNNTTQDLQEVAQLLYTNYGDGVLALGSNGTMKMWTLDCRQHNQLDLGPIWKVPTRVLPPSSGLAMTNDVTGVNLEEAVPCMALSKDDSYITACGGKVSLYWTLPFMVNLERTFMPPPPASTFLAFHPQDNDVIAIGMEDSTIRIYNHSEHMVKSELKGHEKRITGLAFSTNLNILVSSAADAQLRIWRIDTWEHLKSVSIQLPPGKACNGDTRVQFHFDQIRLLVSHETQLAIYDAFEMDCIRQWVLQDVLPAPISFAVYSCDGQLVYTSFCDGNIGVFDADSLTLACRIVTSIYLYPTMLSRGQAVYPKVIAAHPKKPNQFAIGLTNGFVVIMEPQESEDKWGLSPSTVDNGMLNDRTMSSSNSTSNHTPDQNGDGPMARSMEKPKTLDDVSDKSKPWKEAETQCQLVVMPNSTDEAHKVARLLYRNGCEVLALGCNGTLRLWRRYSSINNQSGMATASVVPQQWPCGHLMTNDVTDVNLEEAVPCMALSKNYSNIILACGGCVSLFNIETFKVSLERKFMRPPPASTFLAFHPQGDAIIAIGMEDSTICIYYRWGVKVRPELKGHKKHITGLAFSTNLKILVSSGADAQLCIWRINTWELLKLVPIQLPVGKACNGDTRVQFHSDQIRLMVSHETQLAIYDASEMDCIRQWVPQDVLPAPISFAAYSCDGQLVYTSFCDGNIGVFDADSLTLTCYISPSAYFPTLSCGRQAVYPTVVATHPWKPNQFAIGLTNGSVILIEPPESEGKWGLSPIVYHKGMLNDRIASSSNTSIHKPDQEEEVDVDKKLEVDLGMDKDADVDVDEDEGDQEEKRKKEKGKAPQSE